MIVIVILILIALLVLIEFVIEKIYMSSDRYKRGLGGADRFFHVPSDIEICNIGSGPGLHAISYDFCELNGFNFSTAPQNYKYGFRLLHHFKKSIKEDAIVIIVIMAPLSFANNNDYLQMNYSDKYYGILKKKEIDGYSLKRLFIVSHPLLVKVAKKIRSKFIKYSLENNDINNINNEPNVVMIWKKEFNLVDLVSVEQYHEHEEAFKQKISILQKGIDYCYKNKWKPILVMPPIPNKTKSYIGKEFMRKFVYENVDCILKNNTSLKLLDYFDKDLPDDFYKDDIFMNEKGQAYFSKMLFNDIKKVGKYVK